MHDRLFACVGTPRRCGKTDNWTELFKMNHHFVFTTIETKIAFASVKNLKYDYCNDHSDVTTSGANLSFSR